MGVGMRDVAVGSAAGYVATLVMERASRSLYERQSESSRRREEEPRKEMPTTTLLRRVAGLFGKQLSDGGQSGPGPGCTTHSAPPGDRLPPPWRGRG